MFKIIVAGCGAISNAWLAAAVPRGDVQIVALVNRTVEKARALRERYHLECPVYSELTEALEHTDPNLLFDLTSPDMHEVVVTTGLRRGLNVFGEKPLSDNMRSARNIVKAADESSGRYFVMQNRRYLHAIQTLRGLIEREIVGKAYHVSVEMLIGAHFTGSGFREEMEHPLIVDMSIHTFDEARYLLGDARAVSAYCQEYNPPHSWYRGAAGADCIFEMSDGSILSFRGSFASRSENTSSHGFWRVACSEGTAVWDGYDKVWINEARPLPSNRGYYEEEGLRREIALVEAGRQNHEGCLDDMFDALLKNRPMQTDCHNNIHSLSMVHACLESVEAGRKVALNAM